MCEDEADPTKYISFSELTAELIYTFIKIYKFGTQIKFI